jgi:imidazoleglycerol phosphate synthase glutamine amidotransferase subunit HisH
MLHKQRKCLKIIKQLVELYFSNNYNKKKTDKKYYSRQTDYDNNIVKTLIKNKNHKKNLVNK